MRKLMKSTDRAGKDQGQVCFLDWEVPTPFTMDIPDFLDASVAGGSHLVMYAGKSLLIIWVAEVWEDFFSHYSGSEG